MIKKWYFKKTEAERSKINKHFHDAALFYHILAAVSCFSFYACFFADYPIAAIVGSIVIALIYIFGLIIVGILFPKWNNEIIDSEKNKNHEIIYGKIQTGFDIKKINITKTSSEENNINKSENFVNEDNKEKISRKEKIEQSRKRNSQERIIKILKDFVKLENNKNLEIIINRFIKNNQNLSIEINAVPIRDNTSNGYKANYKIEDLYEIKEFDSSKIAYTFETAYKKIKRASSLNINYYDNKKKIDYLVQSLKEQHIITKQTDNLSFTTFLNEKYHKYRKDEYERLNKEYHFESNTQNDFILNNFTEINLNENEKIYYFALKYYNENEYKMFSDCFFDAEKTIQDYYKQKDREKYIKNLLNNPNSDKLTKKYTIDKIDKMNGFEFEEFIALLFKKIGYKTSVTKLSGDQGIDILAVRNNITLAIQAKCYSGIVGNHAIMEAAAGVKFYNADKCLVVTNSTFSKSAIELAKANGVELWDRKKLIEQIGDIDFD